MDLVAFEERRQQAKRRWQAVAFSVPVSLLAGETLYGTFSSMNVSWLEISQWLFMGVFAGIVALRLTRRLWLIPWDQPVDPTDRDMERLERDAYKFLFSAWGFSLALALVALSMFLMAAPRQFPYIFELLSISYFLLYYPRRSLFAALWGKKTLSF